MKPDHARPKNEPHQLAHDQPYAWGRPPSTYLPFRAIIRLAILRSKLESRPRASGSAHIPLRPIPPVG